MATSADFIAHVIDQSGLSGLSTRRMFGEYALYLDGRVVGFAADNSLFVKFTEATTALTRGLPARPLFPGSNDYAVADELLDDRDALRGLLIATAAALPLAKIKTKTRTAKATGTPGAPTGRGERKATGAVKKTTSAPPGRRR